MDKVEYSLSRLALAKAIKTPDAEEDAEPWTKSVIFNQPFIKELHKQKQQLINHSQQKYRLETKNHCHKQQRQVHHHLQQKNYHHQQHNRKYSGSELSHGQDKKASKSSNKPIIKRTYLPSDYESEEQKQEEDYTVDDLKVLKVKHQEYQEEKRPASRSLGLNKDKKPRPKSIESVRDDVSICSHSRGSASTHTAPLTEGEEEEDIPKYNTISNHSHHPYGFKTIISEEYNRQTPVMRLPSADMNWNDQLQQHQRFQQQLQFQQQLEYQQQLQYQHFQQQQQYLLAQNPSNISFQSYAGAPIKGHCIGSNSAAVMMMSPISTPQYNHNAKKKTGNINNLGNGHITTASKNYSSTDKRRRAEMLRTSNSTTSTPSMVRTNNKRTSYNI